MLEFILTAIELILVAVFIGLLIGFVLRMLGCLFSADSRKKVRNRPVLHAVWLITSVLLSANFYVSNCGCINPAEPHECRFKIELLGTAMEQFHERYGRFPLQSESEDHAYVTDQARLIRILCGTDNNLQENPDGIIFLEVKSKDKGERGMIDPWGNPMHIVADWSGDGRISLGAKVLHQKFAIWSDGPDGKNESGSGDDITSW